MKELSLNILDIAMNSVTAGATRIGICLTEDDTWLKIVISDNGCGMTPDFVARVTDPFTTTRKTRKVGLGLPFFQLAAEQTGGSMKIDSRTAEMSENHGTVITATFCKTHLDFTPLGDIISTVVTLIHTADAYDVVFSHEMADKTVTLDSTELRQTLGEEIPLSRPEVLQWIRAYLSEQYQIEN